MKRKLSGALHLSLNSEEKSVTGYHDGVTFECVSRNGKQPRIEFSGNFQNCKFVMQSGDDGADL